MNRPGAKAINGIISAYAAGKFCSLHSIHWGVKWGLNVTCLDSLQKQLLHLFIPRHKVLSFFTRAQHHKTWIEIIKLSFIWLHISLFFTNHLLSKMHFFQRSRNKNLFLSIKQWAIPWLSTRTEIFQYCTILYEQHIPAPLELHLPGMNQAMGTPQE